MSSASSSSSSSPLPPEGSDVAALLLLRPLLRPLLRRPPLLRPDFHHYRFCFVNVQQAMLSTTLPKLFAFFENLQLFLFAW